MGFRVGGLQGWGLDGDDLEDAGKRCLKGGCRE